MNMDSLTDLQITGRSLVFTAAEKQLPTGIRAGREFWVKSNSVIE
jgi:hypothetical protein